MNFDQSSRAIAEIFSEIANIFAHTCSDDGLRLLLSYSLEITGLQRGKVEIDDAHQVSKREVTQSDSFDSTGVFSQSIVDRARISLQPESTVNTISVSPQIEYAFPLRLQGISLGVIHLAGSENSTLSEHSIAVMQSVADVAATSIFQTHRIQQAHMLANQLQNALESRVMIEQAKGIVAERKKIDLIKAFQEIRSQSRQEQRPVVSVASDIVARHRDDIVNTGSPVATSNDF